MKNTFCFVVGLHLTVLLITAEATREKVCLGTQSGMISQGKPMYRYRLYKAMYKDCTYIDGNLEIVYLNDFDYDLSFLENIKVVRGYVLLAGNYVKNFHLDRLTVIRGASLYSIGDITDLNEYSLFVALNVAKQMGLKNLREIIRGKVMFQDNPMLCYTNTINWKDILTTPVNHMHKRFTTKTFCGSCDPSCKGKGKKLHCWGEGPDMCQSFSKLICSQSCPGRCFGRKANECCYSQCAGGCWGPKDTECFSCRNFWNEGVCVEICPPIVTYDPELYDWKKTENGKFAFGPVCVTKCPDHLVVYGNACVKSCPMGYSPDKSNTCTRCVGSCPKVCREKVDIITKENIHLFANCTIIEDNIRILYSTLAGDMGDIPSYPLDPAELYIFQSVREVHGFVHIEDKRITNLSFLNNLEVIYGNQLDGVGASLHIVGVKNLKMLDLTSLRDIKNGEVQIRDNPHLCYADTINFSKIVRSKDQKVAIIDNRPLHKCLLEDSRCHKECNADGCWGPGPERCVGCINMKVFKRKLCVNKCKDIPRHYDRGNTCYKCHKECSNSFSGPSLFNCTDTCPSNKPVVITVENEGRVCVGLDHLEAVKLRWKNNTIITIVCTCVGVILIIAFFVVLFVPRRAKIMSDTLNCQNVVL